ncbi:unnamed protein product [Polarella glacialis]|uniref:Methanethiol oxidase n=1 Tax=Polarella glacialis TaxID=89957 RepID=A0A813K1Z5_POLGL|nr:unnamed protein product [Polarella glacialis]
MSSPSVGEMCSPRSTTPAITQACCASKTQAGFGSPLEAMVRPREKLMYIPAVMKKGGDQPDYLATVDADPSSATYSQVIHRLQMPEPGDELHHMGWNACASCTGQAGRPVHGFLVAPGVLSGNIYFIDVHSEPTAPCMSKVLKAAELAEKVGVAIPHTSHCLPDELLVSFMGSRNSDGGLEAEGAGFVRLDPRTLEVLGRWESADNSPRFGYDFWYQPRHNVMISSEWGHPDCFTKGFNPADVAEGKYGSKLYIWDWAKKSMIQEIDVGQGSIPLEVGCALSSELRRISKNKDGIWDTECVVKVPNVPVEGWCLPEMPALITDFCISLDDRFVYLSCWLHGDVRQYKVSDDGREMKLVGQVFLGGLLKKGGPVKRLDGEAQPEPLVVKGVEIQGGSQMLQLSLDGKRLFASTSLFSSWDVQFYPDMVSKGAQLLQLDVDTENGGLKLNTDFFVDFGTFVVVGFVLIVAVLIICCCFYL